MPGFDFSNDNRNATLHTRGVPLPKATSTDTTIVGCIFNDGVVIAADTKVTSGPIVADKNCRTYQHGNGTIEEVQSDGMTVCYVGRGGNSSNTVPFLVGFKMISSNSVLWH